MIYTYICKHIVLKLLLRYPSLIVSGVGLLTIFYAFFSPHEDLVTVEYHCRIIICQKKQTKQNNIQIKNPNPPHKDSPNFSFSFHFLWPPKQIPRSTPTEAFVAEDTGGPPRTPSLRNSSPFMALTTGTSSPTSSKADLVHTLLPFSTMGFEDFGNSLCFGREELQIEMAKPTGPQD